MANAGTRPIYGALRDAMAARHMTVDDVATIAGVLAIDVESMMTGDIYPPGVRRKVAAALLVEESDLWIVAAIEPRRSAMASRLVADDSDDVWTPRRKRERTFRRVDESGAVRADEAVSPGKANANG